MAVYSILVLAQLENKSLDFDFLLPSRRSNPAATSLRGSSDIILRTIDGIVLSFLTDSPSFLFDFRIIGIVFDMVEIIDAMPIEDGQFFLLFRFAVHSWRPRTTVCGNAETLLDPPWPIVLIQFRPDVVHRTAGLLDQPSLERVDDRLRNVQFGTVLVEERVILEP